MESDIAVADWFSDAIVDGIQRLYALQLEGAPSHETVPLTASTWTDVLWTAGVWEFERDADRIATGFRLLARTGSRWPAPSQLRDCMPARAQQFRLEPPAIVPSNRARAVSDALLGRLKRGRDPLQWARKILANPSEYPAYSVECATQALAGGEQREPGDDDE